MSSHSSQSCSNDTGASAPTVAMPHVVPMPYVEEMRLFRHCDASALFINFSDKFYWMPDKYVDLKSNLSLRLITVEGESSDKLYFHPADLIEYLQQCIQIIPIDQVSSSVQLERARLEYFTSSVFQFNLLHEMETRSKQQQQEELPQSRAANKLKDSPSMYKAHLVTPETMRQLHRRPFVVHLSDLKSSGVIAACEIEGVEMKQARMTTNETMGTSPSSVLSSSSSPSASSPSASSSVASSSPPRILQTPTDVQMFARTIAAETMRTPSSSSSPSSSTSQQYLSPPPSVASSLSMSSASSPSLPVQPGVSRQLFGEGTSALDQTKFLQAARAIVSAADGVPFSSSAYPQASIDAPAATQQKEKAPPMEEPDDICLANLFSMFMPKGAEAWKPLARKFNETQLVKRDHLQLKRRWDRLLGKTKGGPNKINGAHILPPLLQKVRALEQRLKQSYNGQDIGHLTISDDEEEVDAHLNPDQMYWDEGPAGAGGQSSASPSPQAFIDLTGVRDALQLSAGPSPSPTVQMISPSPVVRSQLNAYKRPTAVDPLQSLRVISKKAKFEEILMKFMDREMDRNDRDRKRDEEAEALKKQLEDLRNK